LFYNNNVSRETIMSKLQELYNKLKRFDLNRLAGQILNENAGKIYKMQTDRLYNEGKYYDGKIIRTYRAKLFNVYAFKTIMRKKLNNQPFNRVTLFNKGNFYKSIRVRANRQFLTIKANFNKRKGKISDNLDTDKVLGLTAENKEQLKIIVLNQMNLRIKKLLKNG